MCTNAILGRYTCDIICSGNRYFASRKGDNMNMTEDKKLVISSKKYTGETGTVTARLPLTLIEKLDKIAESTGRTRNDIIQKCLEFSIENTEVVDK